MPETEPRLILQSQREYDIDRSALILVGDKESDIEAGLTAKIGTLFLYVLVALSMQKARKLI